jgi:hypothetical protein
MTTPLFAAGVGLLPFAESGATVEFSWGTDIRKFWSGLEQRNSYRSRPQQKYNFPVSLEDGAGREVMSMLARYAHTAPVFRLPLPYEGLPIVSSTSSTVTVASLTFCDWAVAGQRVVIEAPSGAVAETVVASSAGSVITVDDDASGVSTSSRTRRSRSSAAGRSARARRSRPTTVFRSGIGGSP